MNRWETDGFPARPITLFPYPSPPPPPPPFGATEENEDGSVDAFGFIAAQIVLESKREKTYKHMEVLPPPGKVFVLLFLN